MAIQAPFTRVYHDDDPTTPHCVTCKDELYHCTKGHVGCAIEAHWYCKRCNRPRELRAAVNG